MRKTNKVENCIIEIKTNSNYLIFSSDFTSAFTSDEAEVKERRKRITFYFLCTDNLTYVNLAATWFITYYFFTSSNKKGGCNIWWSPTGYRVYLSTFILTL